MSRFYINDGVRPGRRAPTAEYAKWSPGVGSCVLNEAQAIARGLKLTATIGEPVDLVTWADGPMTSDTNSRGVVIHDGAGFNFRPGWYAFDRNPSTSFCGGFAGTWLYHYAGFCFNSPVIVTSVTVTHGNTWGYYQYSLDGVNWTGYVEINNGTPTTVNPTKVPARYHRVTTPGAGNYSVINEIIFSGFPT